MSLNILEKSSCGILYEMPPGKPNPKQMAQVGKDTRDRVYQTPQKGQACVYYTFNFLRERVGKYPCDEIKEARRIEVLFSTRRKKITQIEAFINQTNRTITRGLESTSQEFAELFKIFKENLTHFLNEENFKLRLSYNLQFLEQLNIDPIAQFCSEITPANGYDCYGQKDDYNSLDSQQKLALTEAFINRIQAKEYGLKISSWTPSARIENLIDELVKNGPLAVFGHLGRYSYQNEPFKMQNPIKDRAIFAWKPASERKELSVTHAVLLVGAKKIDEGQFVFFIDPCDGSDPTDKAKQKIYMISYKNLCTHIFDLHGRQSHEDPSPGYAYHGTWTS